MAKSPVNTATGPSNTEISSITDFNAVNPIEGTEVSSETAATDFNTLREEYMKNGYTYNEVLGCFSLGGL